ncbi:MAG: ATP synthase F1 subunit epsilon [Balneolaceae bacterium]|nr:ATP synthase F1 subunit epsilon [Balneolaceae bacterium]
MAKTYQAQLLTPEGSRFKGEVESVRVPGSNGNFQMLHNHAPIVSSLGIGKITIKQEGVDELNFAVSGGFVEMSNNQLTILAEKAEKSSDIDIEEAEQLIGDIKEKLESLDYRNKEVETELAIAENRLKVAEA